MSIRSVDDDFDISEDSIGLFALPDTISHTRYNVVKNILTHSALPLPLCHGPAVLEGRRKGLAPHIRGDVPWKSSGDHCKKVEPLW